MELTTISDLYALAAGLMSAFDDHFAKNDFQDRLRNITHLLESAQKKLEEVHGLAFRNGVVNLKRIKYGLQRMEFLVNETNASYLQGKRYSNNYLKRLAKDVLQDVPLLTDPSSKGKSLVEEVGLWLDREREREDIVQILLHEDSIQRHRLIVSVVSIFGMTGTGKTYLARLVYNDQRVQNHFRRVWVDVSGVQSDRQILCQVLRSIGCGDDGNIGKYSMRQLMSMLKEELREHKWLIVLDDLYTEASWTRTELLQLLLPACASYKHGGKILVTSNYTYVERPIQMPMAKVMLRLEPPHLNKFLTDFKKIGLREITEEDRTPHFHAILSIASILSSQSTNQKKWQFFKHLLCTGVGNAVNNIGSLVDLLTQKSQWYEQTQQLLTYSSLFPLDYKFNKQELQQLWEVQGLIHQVPSVKIFDDFFEQLLATGFFFENKKLDRYGVIISYTIQTLMHEVVKHLASDNHRLLDKPAKEVDVQHVSFIADPSWEAPSWLHDAQLLKTLLFLPTESCRTITIPNINNILASLKSLQVLDLAIVHCGSCPESLRELKQLRYLRLGISFEFLPECITNLKYLSTLDLRHSAIQELPKNFHKLSCLRHLYTGGRLIDLPPRFGELTNLETLDVFIVGKNNGLDALARILCLSGKLKVCYQKSREKHMLPFLGEESSKIVSVMELDDLSLVWSSSNEDLAIDAEQEEDVMEFEFLQPPESLTSLGIQGWKGMTFPPWVMYWFSILPKVRFLHIVDSRRCQCLPSFSSLSSLESLQLRGLDALEFIEICQDISRASVTEFFPSLKYLGLVNLPQLKGWSKVEDHDVDCQQQTHEKEQYVPQKIFKCLSELKVSGCPELMSMPLVPSLESLEVVGIHAKLLKHLLSLQEPPTSSSLALSASPTLKELHINSVHELQSLSITITSLQVLTITECTELTNVLVESSNSLKRLKFRACHRLKDIAMHQLTVLEELEIENCEDLDWVDMMNDIEENGDDSVRASLQGLHSLRSLIVTNITKPQALPRGLVCLKTLKELSLCWLYNLTDLPASIGYLTQLSRLVIRFCPKFQKLPESFPNLKSLKYLEIKECPKLERRCKQPNGEDCKLIDHIPNIHLGKFWYTGRSSNFSESQATPPLTV